MVTADKIEWLFWQKCYGVVLKDKAIQFYDHVSADFKTYTVILSIYEKNGKNKGKQIGSKEYKKPLIELVSTGMTMMKYYAELANDAIQ